jgi:hypothetical protein
LAHDLVSINPSTFIKLTHCPAHGQVARSTKMLSIAGTVYQMGNNVPTGTLHALLKEIAGS